jgi:hypothetical protein
LEIVALYIFASRTESGLEMGCLGVVDGEELESL